MILHITEIFLSEIALKHNSNSEAFLSCSSIAAFCLFVDTYFFQLLNCLSVMSKLHVSQVIQFPTNM